MCGYVEVCAYVLMCVQYVHMLMQAKSAAMCIYVALPKSNSSRIFKDKNMDPCVDTLNQPTEANDALVTMIVMQ